MPYISNHPGVTNYMIGLPTRYDGSVVQYPGAVNGQAGGNVPMVNGRPVHPRPFNMGPAFPPGLLKPGELFPSVLMPPPVNLARYLGRPSAAYRTKRMLIFSAVMLYTLGGTGFISLLAFGR